MSTTTETSLSSYTAYTYAYYGLNAPRTIVKLESGAETVLLSPRPLAKNPAVFTLVPLLEKRPPRKNLPAEVWSKIMKFAIDGGTSGGKHSVWHSHPSQNKNDEKNKHFKFKWNLLLVSKEFKVCFHSYFIHFHRRSLT